MSCLYGHGMDAVSESDNAKARWAGTHRADCVCLPTDLLAPFSKDQTSTTATPTERCFDGIGILQQRP